MPVLLLALVLGGAGRPPALVVESCDLWSPAMWAAVRRERPDWEPHLGFYASDDPRVSEAHVRLAQAHGIAGLQTCWYRAHGNAGRPVVPLFDGFAAAMAGGIGRGRVAWDIFWDNANPAGDGMHDARDFVDHVAAYWIAHYLRRPDYLRLDGRPVVGIASVRAFAADAGGAAGGRRAMDGFRAAARAAGLPGVFVLGANNGDPRSDVALARDLGFDAVMAYATPPFTGLLRQDAPRERVVRDAEQLSWSLAARHARLPTLITASVGFDQRLWSLGHLHYMLGPDGWEDLLRAAVAAARSRAMGDPARRIVLLDALNEFGEGHFIEPTKATGFAYVDAVARVAASEGTAGPETLR